MYSGYQMLRSEITFLNPAAQPFPTYPRCIPAAALFLFLQDFRFVLLKALKKMYI